MREQQTRLDAESNMVPIMSVVRCHAVTPSPYLVRWEKPTCRRAVSLSICCDLRAVDLGCGCGRNSEYLRKRGWHVVAFDKAPGYARAGRLELGQEYVPVWDGSADLILLQYLMMFLDAQSRSKLMRDVVRIAGFGARLLVELYPAKDSFTPTQKDCDALQKELLSALGEEWHIRHNVKNRFLAEKAPRGR